MVIEFYHYEELFQESNSEVLSTNLKNALKIDEIKIELSLFCNSENVLENWLNKGISKKKINRYFNK
jgi:hypothetical protein